MKIERIAMLTRSRIVITSFPVVIVVSNKKCSSIFIYLLILQ